jgi:microcystin-dependent protein
MRGQDQKNARCLKRVMATAGRATIRIRSERPLPHHLHATFSSSMQALERKQQIEMQAGMAKAQAEIAEALARAALVEANAKAAQVKLQQEELRLQEMQMRLAQTMADLPWA